MMVLFSFSDISKVTERGSEC